MKMDKDKKPVTVKSHSINGVNGYHHPATKKAEKKAKDKGAFHSGQAEVHNQQYARHKMATIKYEGEDKKDCVAAADWHYHQSLAHLARVDAISGGNDKSQQFLDDRVEHEEKYSKMSHNDHKVEIYKEAKKAMSLEKYPMLKAIGVKIGVIDDTGGSPIKKSLANKPLMQKAITVQKTGKELKYQLKMKADGLLEKLNYETGAYMERCKHNYAEKMKEYEGKEDAPAMTEVPEDSSGKPIMPYNIRNIGDQLAACQRMMRNLEDKAKYDLDVWELKEYGF